MEANLAFSKIRAPHNGKFIRCRVVKFSTWTRGNPISETFVHLEMQRDGGPNVVLRMDIHAAQILLDDFKEQLEFALKS